jgi:formylglycine-generating enzyme required for sulfatase activity
MRLRDIRTKKVLAEAVCSSHPAKGDSVGELAADNGAGLRDVVGDVAEFCADDYRHRVLGL